jgi:hypothetical protein
LAFLESQDFILLKFLIESLSPFFSLIKIVISNHLPSKVIIQTII